MKLNETGKNWDTLGKEDPLFAVLTLKDKRGHKWDEKEFFETGKNAIKETLEYLKNLKIKLNYEKALDFGCGVGRLTLALTDYFKEVHGVDIAPSMIAAAGKYATKVKKCFYHLNEKNDLKIFPDAHFDFVLSKITLQHMEPRYAKNYIKEFLRVLKLDGVAVFQVPEKRVTPIAENDSLKTRIKNLIPEPMLALYRRLTPNARPLIEMYGIPSEEIKTLVRENGGEIIEVKEDKNAEKWTSFEYLARKT